MCFLVTSVVNHPSSLPLPPSLPLTSLPSPLLPPFPSSDGEKVLMSPLRDGSKPFVGLAFKLEVQCYYTSFDRRSSAVTVQHSLCFLINTVTLTRMLSYTHTHTHSQSHTHTHTHTVKHTYTHMTECEHNGLQYTSTFRSGTVQNGTLSACSSFMPRLPKHSKVTQISNYNYRRMNTCSEAHTHLPNIQMHITRVPPRLVGLVS